MTTDIVLLTIIEDDLATIRKAIAKLRRREKYILSFLRAEKRKMKKSQEWQEAHRLNKELAQLDQKQKGPNSGPS